MRSTAANPAVPAKARAGCVRTEPRYGTRPRPPKLPNGRVAASRRGGPDRPAVARAPNGAAPGQRSEDPGRSPAEGGETWRRRTRLQPRGVQQPRRLPGLIPRDRSRRGARGSGRNRRGRGGAMLRRSPSPPANRQCGQTGDRIRQHHGGPENRRGPTVVRPVRTAVERPRRHAEGLPYPHLWHRPASLAIGQDDPRSPVRRTAS